MTIKEAHVALDNAIKELYEKYPEANPFNPICPFYEEWREAMNKETERLVREYFNKPTSK